MDEKEFRQQEHLLYLYFVLSLPHPDYWSLQYAKLQYEDKSLQKVKEEGLLHERQKIYLKSHQILHNHHESIKLKILQQKVSHQIMI